jgi:Holliday junction resolvase RusA-like endonuclease
MAYDDVACRNGQARKRQEAKTMHAPLLHVVLDVPPFPLLRHRTRLVRPRPGTVFMKEYPDPDSFRHAAQLKTAFLIQFPPYKWRPLDGPLMLSATFCFEPLKSWPKWKQEAALAGKINHAVIPDLSNFIKQIEDALNGLAWSDDGRIARYHDCAKIYGPKPYTAFSLWKLPEPTTAEQWKAMTQPSLV